MHRCIIFILFWNDIVHASDGLSVYHQEFKTLHVATGICQTVLLSASLHHREFKTVHTVIGICQTDTAVCLLTNRQLYLLHLLHLVSFTVEIALRCKALWKSNSNRGLFENSYQGAVLEHHIVFLLIHCVHHNDVKWIVIYISQTQWFLE